MNSVATTFATQPICNAARAAHALRSDQNFEGERPLNLTAGCGNLNIVIFLINAGAKVFLADIPETWLCTLWQKGDI
jgi:hypothetical protein